MPAYERFATFYDEVMDDPEPRAEQVRTWIARYQPEATSLLELGCGTGSLLARLPSLPSLTGVDRSPEMLSVARGKVPGAHLVEADMRQVDLARRFDVVACVFDSLNHLLSFDGWEATFEVAHGHLAEGGLFVFDVNTVSELRRLGDDPPLVVDFEGGTAVIDVSVAQEAPAAEEAPVAEGPPAAGDPAASGPVTGDAEGPVLSSWDIRIFEHVSDTRYELHHERIAELAVPLARVESALRGRFAVLESVDEAGSTPTDDSVKGHYACRRLS